MDQGWQDLSDRRRAIERERDGRPVGVVGEDIRASWARCRAIFEIDQPQVAVDESVVAECWAASPIRRMASPVVTQLAETARDAGMLAVVTDPKGQVLWGVAPPELRSGAEGVGLVPGGHWDESAVGTNGIGMALVTRQPVSVFADEHWCAPVRDWVCYSAPVRDATGDVIGVIDLSTTWDRTNPLALRTVGALARLMEVEVAAAGTLQPGLDIRALGRGRVLLDGEPIGLSPRQVELLVVLATARSA